MRMRNHARTAMFTFHSIMPKRRGILDYGRGQESLMNGQPRLDGKKFDEGKPQMSFVTRSLMVAIASIMAPGAVKYGRDNYKGGMIWSRPYDALLRHITAWWENDGADEESGKSHLWHAACELMFLIEYEAKGTGQDDRYKAAK